MSQEFDPRVKQVLDGEASARDLPPALRAEAEAALRVLAALDRRPVTLSPRLDARVMAAVRQHAAAPRHRAWRWFTAPSVPPWALAAAAAAAFVAFYLLFRPAVVGSPGAASPLATPAGPESIYVKFVLTAPSAQRVALAGTFNSWDPNATPLTRGEAGTWVVTIPLTAGQHQYAFIVDGQRWVPDPAAPKVDDGFGRKNSVVSVSATRGRVL